MREQDLRPGLMLYFLSDAIFSPQRLEMEFTHSAESPAPQDAQYPELTCPGPQLPCSLPEIPGGQNPSKHHSIKVEIYFSMSMPWGRMCQNLDRTCGDIWTLANGSEV